MSAVWLIGRRVTLLNGHAYTTHKFDAGRYTKSEAESEAKFEPHNIRALAPPAPAVTLTQEQVTVRSFSDLTAHGR